ncbi:MAG: hypothetical protein LC737_04620 [Chloroflexi bacterium]|nr:hypothetical protein [Chloroflexota bacterium]
MDDLHKENDQWKVLLAELWEKLGLGSRYGCVWRKRVEDQMRASMEHFEGVPLPLRLAMIRAIIRQRR